MTTETQGNEQLDADANTGGDQETVEGLKAELERARSEAAKFRKQKTDLAKERDELKGKVKTTDNEEQNYKQLWTEAQSKAQKMLDKVKNSDVSSALQAQLTKVGVRADALDAAAALVDRSLIQWSEDDGLEQASVEAAVQVLKGKYKLFFEKALPGQDGKLSTDGTSSLKTIKRAEFDALDLYARRSKITDGFKVTD